MMFERIDLVAMTGTLIVSYHIDRPNWSAEVRATPAGVLIMGLFPTMSIEECVTFEEAIARARVQTGQLSQSLPPLSEEEVDRILGPIPQYEAQT